MTNNKQQTAIDIYAVELLKILGKTLVINLTTEQTNKMHRLFIEAKKMEKEKIETAYNKGTVHGIDYPESTLPLTGEQYYNETYGGNK